MIHVTDISFSWPGSGVMSLEGVDFEAEPGAIVCLAGCNGSGKSTLLQVLAGILEPQSGSIVVQGGGQFARSSALLLQDADMQILGATVAEDLLLAWPKPDAGRIDAARDLVGRLGLEPYWDAPVHTLSYGQKRKLCLATALLSEPACLLLDEPFSGLDYPAIVELRRLFVTNRGRGLVQIVSTHDLEPLADLADYALVLHGGRQAFFGSPEAALAAVAFHSEWGLRTPCSWRLQHSLASWDRE